MGVRQAALAVVAVVVAVANSGVEAARYEDNLLTEFTFSQAECKTRAFADSVTENYLGGLTYPSSWTTLEKCPTYTDGDGTVFEYAYNGMHSVGARYLASGSGTNLTLDDSAKSTSSVASLLTELDGITDFTLEFWIRPSFTSGSDSSKYVLMEIGAEPGTGQDVGDSYSWACSVVGTQNYNLQLLYDNGAANFVLEYRYGSSTNNCESFNLDADLTTGKLYQVLLVASYNSGSGVFTANLQVHAEDESVDSSDSDFNGDPISFSNFDSSHVLRLGSSPFTLSGLNTGATPYHSFPGDILHFSFYNESLGSTEIADNFAAKLLNSGPVPANDVVRQTFSEDEYTAVDLTKAVFDFDDVFFDTESMTYTLTSSTDGDFLGNSFRYNGNVITAPASVNPDVTDLQWMNGVVDDWGWSNTTFFTVTGSDGSMTSAVATLSPEAVGTNDAPEQTVGTETAAHTPQAGAQLLTFSVTDADCATRQVQYSDGVLDTQDETLLDNSCTTLGGIDSVTVLAPADAVKLGVLFRPNSTLHCPPYDSSTMTEITVNTTFTSADAPIWSSSSDGVVEVYLCFEACLSYDGSENPCPAGVDGGASAILGNSTFQFYATDEVPAVGPTGTVTTTVTNVLTMTEQTDLITYEETALEITLSGSDEFCERFDSVLCPRAKSFLIDTLPPASEGIFYLDEELTTPLVEGETYAGADNATLTVYLMPATDYFSANEWPICGPAISTESNPVSAWSFSYCINEDDGIDTFPCEGPLCNGYYNTMPSAFGEALTTADLEGNAMGGCGADVSEGCPVELLVSLVVGNLTSEPLAGASVHVININDEPEIIIPAANLSGVVRAVDTAVSWTDSNGDTTYISIADSDGDARVMDLVLSTPSSGQLSFQDVNRSLPTLRFSVNQASSSQGDTLIGLTGTVTSLNYALQHLHYIVPAARREDTVTLYVLDESRDIGPASFNVDDLNEKAVEGSGYVVDTELEVYFDNAVDTQSFAVGAVVLWASIIGATLLCCGCVYSVVHAVVRRALMGERAAMWIVRNVFFTHITDAKDEDLTPEARRLSRIAMTRIHAEEVTMTRVFCCLHLLACLCPCCIKFKGDKTMLPTKDAMLAATVSDLSHGMAKKHLPGDAAPRITELTTREAMEYEEHEVVTNDGRVRKYLFNPHTGRSLWMANVRIVHSAHGPNSSSDDSD